MLRTLRTRSSRLADVGPMEHDDAVLVLPYIDAELLERTQDVLVRRARAAGLLVLVDDDQRLGFMKIANYVFARSASRHFGYLAQDAFPGEDWLRAAVSTLDASGADLLAFNDGRFHGTLAVFGLARRQWINGLYRNSLFYPGYNRHFGDTELTAIAVAQERLVYNPGCMMVEVDYDKHRRRNDPDDAALYKRRAATGFDGRIPPFEA